MVAAARLVEKAVELGYDKCGIVPLERMAGYARHLDRRMRDFPETRTRYEKFHAFAVPQKQYPWARSVVICSFWYGTYRIPENLDGRVAKYYLTDGRRNARSDGFKTCRAFAAYLQAQGLRIAFEPDFGATALRWAAQEAGIGIIRKNNFLYTERGSWQYLEAFLIDRPLEYVQSHNLRPCAAQCNLCQRSCPTRSLAAPYAMNRNTCVSDLTTWSGWDLTQEPLRDRFGDWIYGCDACQDACPHNRNAWAGTEEFPGLEALSQRLSLLQIVEAAYSDLEQAVQPALWYIPAAKSWRYKTNALNAMLNRYRPEYLPAIQKACCDEKEPVRKMAGWVLTQLEEAVGARTY